VREASPKYKSLQPAAVKLLYLRAVSLHLSGSLRDLGVSLLYFSEGLRRCLRRV
jgi:hypothetical protein